MKPHGIGVVAVVIALGLAGCSSQDSGTEGTAMAASIDEVTERAAELLDASTDELEVVEDFELSPGSCRVYGFRVAESLDPYPVHLASLPDGELVDYDTDLAADTILRACFTNPSVDDGASSVLSAATVAEVIVRFGRLPGIVDLAEADSASPRLAELGTEFREPSLATGADGTTVQFFARDLERGGFLEVTARWAADGTVSTDFQEWRR